MCSLINTLMNAMRKFTVVDLGLFKIYLVSVGVLLGSYFSAFFIRHISVVWTVAVVTLIIVVVQLVRYSCGCCKKED